MWKYKLYFYDEAMTHKYYKKNKEKGESYNDFLQSWGIDFFWREYPTKNLHTRKMAEREVLIDAFFKDKDVRVHKFLFEPINEEWQRDYDFDSSYFSNQKRIE